MKKNKVKLNMRRINESQDQLMEDRSVALLVELVCLRVYLQTCPTLSIFFDRYRSQLNAIF